MRMKLGFLVCLTIGFSPQLFGITQASVTVSKVGVHGPNGYFRLVEPPALPCSYSVIYFDIRTEFGKTAYATILAAKASETTLTRIDYNQDSDGKCTLALVEMGG